MKKLLLLTPLLLLSACGGDNKPITPGVIAIQVPDLPIKLSQKAPRLPKFSAKNMGEGQIDATIVDQKYNALAFQANSLIDFYNCVKLSVNTKADLTKCLITK